MVGIIPTSGAPMQSAARVPILVSFEVEDYPGPDNDPILKEGIERNDGGGIFRKSSKLG